MKGRPRPISLKTDVIKSRNRSKGKATSKDRAGANAKAKERSESTSRSREEGVVGKKSAPGGADEDDEMSDGRQKPFGDGAFSDADGRKARKTGAPAPYGMVPMPYGAPGAYPYPYPYPYQPHPHQHQPYPPPRSRSRSSDSSRRAQSLDGRAGGDPRRATPGAPPAPGSPYQYPPPPGYHPGAPGLHPEGGYYPGYPYGGAYGGQPGYYPPGPHYPGAHPHALAHAQALQPPAITHAQSDSRSHSPAATPTGSEAGDPPNRASASPPHPSTSAAPPAGAAPSYYPHPNPNYHLHQPYTHSPLAASAPRMPGTSAAPPTSILRPGSNGAATNGRPANGSPSTAGDAEVNANGRVTLAPMVHFGGANGSAPDGSPRSSHASSTETVHAGGDKVHLPSIGSVSGQQSPPAPVGRHTGLFEARRDGVPGSEIPATVPSTSDGRLRGASVSSNSAASVSGSSDGGLRSPETTARSLVGGSWAKPGGTNGWSTEDERRGRPERRYDEPAKGKGREFEEIDELDEDDEAGDGHRRMVGVETGLGELRVVDPWGMGGSPATSASKLKAEGSSRSRSSGHGREERGRSRGHGPGGRSQSTSRARGLAPSSDGGRSSSSGRVPLSAEAEITRLKTKVAELTFLNGLMQSRLGQLEGPGRVPHNTMTSLTAETPRPDPDEMYDEQQDAEDEELERYGGVSAKDPAMRAILLQFFRSQASAAGADGTAASS